LNIDTFYLGSRCAEDGRQALSKIREEFPNAKGNYTEITSYKINVCVA